jgi:hypothetical protein
MLAFDAHTVPPTSWLTLLGSEIRDVPQGMNREMEQLRMRLRQGLLGRHEEIEALLEELLPAVWDLRIRALPLLAQTNLSEALKKVELEFSLVPQRFPALADAVQKLLFGLHLMSEFVEKFLAANPNLTTELSGQLATEKMPSWHEIVNQGTTDFPAYSLIHASLRMELLLFAIDLATDEQLPLQVGVCYELDYLSATTVKAYAAPFGLEQTQMPWYAAPKNNVGKLLLEGPVVSEADLEYVHEKRAHLNTWK